MLTQTPLEDSASNDAGDWILNFLSKPTEFPDRKEPIMEAHLSD